MNVSAPIDAQSFDSCDDAELLRQYLDLHLEAAFTALVRRHFSFVMHAALRQVSDRSLAEEVTQMVFTDLARKAATLRHHPVLLGWLHTTTRYTVANLTRKLARRSRRDHEGYLMQTISNAGSVDWGQLQPVIDDALQALPSADREAVLLRFFEGQGFSAIGVRLSISENSARMRVNRALQKLGRILEQRGVTSTTAALATALVAGAAETAPAALSAQVASSALASAAAGSGSLAAISLAVKLGWAATFVAATVGGAVAIQQSDARRQAEEQLAAADRERHVLLQQTYVLKRDLAAANQRADDEDADLVRLLAAVSAGHSPQTRTPLGGRPTYNFAEDRFQLGQRLVREGRYEKALSELLWCYDIGMSRVSPMLGVSASALIEELGILASKYEPARAALAQRLADAHKKFDTAWSDNTGLDIAQLDRALYGNNDATLALFESLPRGNPRRARLGLYLFPDLMNAQRYSDIVEVRPYDAALRGSGTVASTQELIQDAPDFLKPALQRVFVAKYAMNVEAFAGAGDLEHAREFAAGLLAFDNSPTAQAVLQAHASRAGHPELATAPK